MLTGIDWPHKDQNDLRVSKALLPLDICLNPRLAGGEGWVPTAALVRRVDSAEDAAQTQLCTGPRNNWADLWHRKATERISVERHHLHSRHSTTLNIVLPSSCAGVCWWRRDGA